MGEIFKVYISLSNSLMITDTVSIAILICTIFYFLLGLLIHFGLTKKYNRSTLKPKICILVAARNEENNITACLDSLMEQTYPSELIQILVMDDRSTDNTRQMVLDYMNSNPVIKLLDITEDRDGLRGKMNALAQGMEQAEGEIILVTDADCRVPNGWVSEMTSHFTERVGLVGSLTIIDRDENNTRIFDHIQTLDWFFLQAIASGTAGVHLPVSVLGNNFGFRKSVYDLIGGFVSIGFSLTEDMALLNTIVRKTDYKIAYPLQSGSMIQSMPVNKIREFIHQRKRWLSGGLKASIWGWILMSTSFVTHFLILINLILQNFTMPFFIGIVLLTGIDLSLVWRVISKSGGKKLVRYFILFEIFYYFYTVILSVGLFLPGKIYWKERRYMHTKKSPDKTRGF